MTSVKYWFTKWKQQRREAYEAAGAKQDIYNRGDVLYYLEPSNQRVCEFTVRSVVQDQHGIRYQGEWNGIISNDFLRHNDYIKHEDVHHDKYALIVQFVENFKHKKYT